MESLAEGFLRNIPEEDRGRIAPYVKEWDGNVTRRFQQLHEQYAPWKELGEYENVQKAVFLQELLQSDPIQFRELLNQTIDELVEQGLIEMPDIEPDVPVTPSVANAEDERLARLEARMMEIAERDEERSQREIEKEEMQELDDLLKTLHNEHGDFDDDWVLIQISRQVDPVDAVKAWNSLIDSKVSSLKPKPAPIPKVMRGGGNNPGGQANEAQKPKTAQERVAYMVQALSDAQS